MKKETFFLKMSAVTLMLLMTFCVIFSACSMDDDVYIKPKTLATRSTHDGGEPGVWKTEACPYDVFYNVTTATGINIHFNYFWHKDQDVAEHEIASDEQIGMTTATPWIHVNHPLFWSGDIDGESVTNVVFGKPKIKRFFFEWEDIDAVNSYAYPYIFIEYQLTYMTNVSNDISTDSVNKLKDNYLPEESNVIKFKSKLSQAVPLRWCEQQQQ